MKTLLFYSVIFILLFLLNSFESNAQNSYGITIGSNISNAKFESQISKEFKLDPIIRFYAGGFTEIALSDKWLIEPVLLYSWKGWEFHSVMLENKGQMNLHYIDLQLLGKYLIQRKISLMGGLETGYLFRTKRNPDAIVLNNLYEKLDISLVLGVEYRMSERLRLHGKYLHGISYLDKYTLTDVNGNETGTSKEGQNRVFQVGMSFIINN